MERFFSKIPPNTELSYVLIPHLSRDHESNLPELISAYTDMPVKQVLEPTEVKPNEVYVIAPDTLLVMDECQLRPLPRPDGHGAVGLIDKFLRSLAADQKENAVGILLSGAGRDGVLGLQSVRQQGGMTLVQTPETCEFDSMPHAAIAAGVVDHVVEVDGMIAYLAEYFQFGSTVAQEQGSDQIREDILRTLPAICEVLEEKVGNDFSNYKRTTLARRIQRRMQMIRCFPAANYLVALQGLTDEADLLFKDLLIGVTEFFRDPEAFDALSRNVLAKLFQEKPSDPIRVWIPGCATGQEAYTLAILFREQMERLGIDHPIQIFATDIDAESVEFARMGVYGPETPDQVSHLRLSRFFKRREQGYQVNKEIREMCIFSVHNVIDDPPFSRMDLVCCRNLLIYFDSTLQQRVIPLFHYALKSGRYLFLGPAESLGNHVNLFKPLDKRLRIFQALESSPPKPVRLPRVDTNRTNRLITDTAFRMRQGRERDIKEIHEQALLDLYVPPSVLVDAAGEVLHFARRTSRYIEPPVGSPSLNIFDTIRDDLRMHLRAGFAQVKRDGREWIKEGIEVVDALEVQRITLIIHAVKPSENSPERYVILFREEGGPRRRGEELLIPPDLRNDEIDAFRHLERELRSTKEWLNSTIEELQNSNEELKSSNEELVSINEEYQSANESLQTSKEELQSLNEELETVNAELSRKVEELDRANADMTNLFASTGIATLFLDRRLRIKKYTPAATEHFSLIDADLGRSIRDITAKFEVGQLMAEIETVNLGGATTELEVAHEAPGSKYIARVTPYRTAEGESDGVVINFIDVTKLKRAEQALQAAAGRKDEFLAMLGHELRNPLAPMILGLHMLSEVSEVSAESKEVCGMLKRQVTHLTRIVDQLLDVSRISRGKVLLRTEPIDLVALTKATIHDQALLVEATQLSISLALPESPVWIKADPTRTSQVLSNIIHNSCKFTPAGGRIAVRLEARNNVALLSISDSGIGMQLGTIENLFEAFAQGETSIDRSTGGLGLGLALVKGLVNLHGGRVWAESPGLNQGSTIRIELPLTDERPLADSEVGHDGPVARKVVVIEDNLDSGDMLVRVLQNQGHHVVLARDGKEGLSVVKESRPEIVFCDIGLPRGMDGYEVARLIREALPDPPPLLVALTGYGQEHDKQIAREAGFDLHVTKPIMVENLLALLATRRSTHSFPAEEGQVYPSQNRSI